MNMIKIGKWTLASLSVVALVACGSSSGTTSTPTPTPSGTPTPTPTVTPTPTPSGTPTPTPTVTPTPTPTPTPVPAPFIIKVRQDANRQFTIPVNPSKTYNYNIDCDSDGTDEAKDVTANYVCEYSAGEINHLISITGNFPAIYFNDDLQSDKDRILSVVQWGTIVWKTMKNAFTGCINMTVEATDTPNLSNVTDMSQMFQAVQKLHTMDVLSWNEWDVSKVQNMHAMFRSSSFNHDISNWNVGKVTDMSQMFYWTTFNQNISKWDVSNVTDMTEMFSGNNNFDQNLGSWDISNITTMKDMFVSPGKLSTPNYDATLIGWWALPHPPKNVEFNAGDSKFTWGGDAEAAHTGLSNAPFNWAITDGGGQP